MGGLGLIPVALILAAIFLTGIVYQRRGWSADCKRFPPPGRMVDIGVARLHVDIRGTGAPPVIFESGIGASSLSWRLVQDEIANFTTTLSYDRTGLGWSDPTRQSRHARVLTDELRMMLQRTGIEAPRVMVAHSFGGLIALDYAARFPDEVAGLVLIDPVGVAEWAEPSRAHRTTLSRGIFLARCGEALARIGVVRFTLDRLAGGARRLPKAMAQATSGRRGRAFMERMAGEIRKLPPEVWPMVQSHWCDPRCFRAMAQHLEALPASAAYVLSEAKSIRAPLIVLSAANASAAQRADHQRVAGLSPHARVEVIEGSNHWIQLDRPDALIRAVREITAAPPS